MTDSNQGPEMTDQTPTLHDRLLTAMAHVGRIKKDGKVDFGNTKYDYMSEEAVKVACQAAVAAPTPAGRASPRVGRVHPETPART